MARLTAKDKLTQSALKLMLRQGYGATSVDEMCSDAGVSKGSFYHFFKGKEAVGLAALEQFSSEGAPLFEAAPYNKISDPLERMDAFLDFIESEAYAIWGSGCLYAIFGSENLDNEPGLMDVVRQKLAEFERAYAFYFRAIESDSGSSAKELGKYFLDVTEGAILMSRVTGDPNRIRDAVRQFRKQLAWME